MLRQTTSTAKKIFLLAVLLVMVFSACNVAEEPDNVRYCELSGSPFERGFTHGDQFKDDIRSFYTTLLTNSLLPYLNREQGDISAFLTEYQKPEYADGQFSYQVLLQSAWNLTQYIPERYMEEMRGVAAGADVPFENILILNTFVDTMLSFRGITYFIKAFQAPHIMALRFLSDMGQDGIDNDGDGEIDEPAEQNIEPYEVSPFASMVEVPIDTSIEFILIDYPEGPNPESIRIQIGTEVFTADCDCIQSNYTTDEGLGLRVVFTPPGGFPAASVVSMIIQAGDKAEAVLPPTPRHRYMRDERVVFTTEGYGKLRHEVQNRGEGDGRTQPPTISFALRGQATKNGEVLLGQHFALLDAGTAHKHTALFLQRPDDAAAHAYLSWVGVIFGFSGMNANKAAYAVNMSDTLDNALVGKFKEDNFKAKLLAYGTPIMVMTREILETTDSVAGALEYMKQLKSTFGWNFLLVDGAGTMSSVEMDSNIIGDPDDGFFTVTPDPTVPNNLDAWGRPLSSVGPDDLFASSHFQRNTEDIDKRLMLVFYVRPQRYWSSYYNRSLRAFYLLGDQLRARYGRFDVAEAIDMMRTPELIDVRDSMNAAVYQPQRLKLHYAMGDVPVTDEDFRTFDMAEELGLEVQP